MKPSPNNWQEARRLQAWRLKQQGWSPRPPARRGRHCPLARRNRAGHQQGAEVQPQMILFRDEAGFDPLPSVVRTYAPVGQPPIVREWCTRDHLSAISAILPEGRLYFHGQDHPFNSADVVGGLDHLSLPFFPSFNVILPYLLVTLFEPVSHLCS
jgi:hypothetical protein